MPIVLILAATLRRAARTPKLAAAIGHTKGNVALKSTADPQAATMRFGNGGVTVVRGVSDDTDVLIAADLNTMADENATDAEGDRRGATSEARVDRRQAARTAARHVAGGSERFFTSRSTRPGVPTIDPDRLHRRRVRDRRSAIRPPSTSCTAASTRCSTCSAATPCSAKTCSTASSSPSASWRTSPSSPVVRWPGCSASEHGHDGRQRRQQHGSTNTSIAWVKTEGISIDGLVIGKHLSTRKFVSALPLGNAITEFVLGYDIGGTPFLVWWDDWRREALGDFHQRPDLSTLVAAPDRPGTANVICDIVDLDGNPVPVCPRSKLRAITERLAGHGLDGEGRVRDRGDALPRVVRGSHARSTCRTSRRCRTRRRSATCTTTRVSS